MHVILGSCALAGAGVRVRVGLRSWLGLEVRVKVRVELRLWLGLEVMVRG